MSWNTITPNILAYATLFLWPVVAIGLFRAQPPGLATIWTIVAGQLLLAPGMTLKIPMVPQFDKDAVPTLCALVGCMISTKSLLRLWSRFGWTELLLCIFVVGPLASSMLNDDPIVVGGSVLPGVGVYDGISAIISQSIAILPFLIGRRYLRSDADAHGILQVFAISGLAYSIPLLFEVRFSPQLNSWVYGYSPTSFAQEMRDGGFRPMVFMGHGLYASLFLSMSVIACAVLWRAGFRILKWNAGGATGYLAVVLYFCKSKAALLYALTMVPLIKWTTTRTQMRIALLLGCLVLVYPALRAENLFPTRTLVDVALSIDPERAQSLEFRFDQEDALLQKAWQRPFFGWGRYGRNRILSENWAGVGVDDSVTDGTWIIVFGQFGLFGFLAEFGLLFVPIMSATLALKRTRPSVEATLLVGLALMLAINMIDLLPNSALSPFTWLIAGAVLGRSEVIRSHVPKASPQTATWRGQAATRQPQGIGKERAV